MVPMYVLFAISALGIEVGWVPLPDGGHEYTIQIEPEMLELLKQQKEEVFSNVPPQIDVRRYRLRVGTGKLARVAGPSAGETASKTRAMPSTPAGGAPADSVRPRDAGQGDQLSKKSRPPLDTTAEARPGTHRPESAAGQDAQTPLAEHEKADHAKAWDAADVPAKLNDDTSAPNPLRTSGFKSPAEEMTVKKPAAESTSSSTAEPNRPWFAFVTALVFLCCSLGANVYLGWTAWEARSQYRAAIAKLRATPAT